MSESNPTYSGNKALSTIEHIGHWLHVAEHDTVGQAIGVVHRGVVTAEAVKSQFPRLGADTATVATDVLACKTLGAALAVMVASGGTNPAADLGVLGALLTDAPALIKLFTDAGILIKTATTDSSIDFKDATGT